MDQDDDGGSLGPKPGVLLAAVEAAGEAILITSADLDAPGPCIEYVNPAFTRMTGYEANEVVGRSPRLLQGPATDPRRAQQHARGTRPPESRSRRKP